MLNMHDDDRIRIIELRILNEVKNYFKVHSQGMGMPILSCKYGKALNALGGFPERITALEVSGMIRVEIAESGARSVFPGEDKPKRKPKEKASDYF